MRLDSSNIAGLCGIFTALATLWLIFSKLSPLNAWVPIVEKYGSNIKVAKYDCRWQSMLIKYMHFSGVVKAAFIPEGVVIALMLPLGWFEKSAFIPWCDLKIIAPDKFGGIVTIGTPVIITVWMSKKLFQGIEKQIATYRTLQMQEEK